MIIEPSDFPNYGHGQNDHFDRDHNTIFIVKWSKLTDLNNNFNKFQQQTNLEL
jgi:hypothetical protein